MQSIQTSPFLCLDELIKKDEEKPDIHFIDFHCETTSEKNALFIAFIDKINGAIIGTHTHVPTNDSKIMFNLAYQTDVGMCGGSLGVIGADSKEIIDTFMKKKEHFKLTPSLTKYQFNAVFIHFDDKTNQPTQIKSIVKYENFSTQN
jgi:calcineurin-like phosphoesterase